ncbi:MAG: SDR family NAD(P)-dependent oxidoreductase [Acidobacteriota bacterium]
MGEHLKNRTVVVTGAAGGFGRLVSVGAAARGARVVAGDIDEQGLESLMGIVSDAGGSISVHATDVTDLASMKKLAASATETFGSLDVLVNNAGVMPLAFFADHEAAADAWSRCLDINIKGVLNGMIAAHDPMTAAGRGHIVNVSSIYGNFPVVGAAVYGATKAAVNFLSESFRVETQGRIKVTTVRPTGVPGTALGTGVINPEAVVGIVGQNAATYLGRMAEIGAGGGEPEELDAQSPRYAVLAPEHIAEQILYAIDQPWGVSIGDITVRATGDGYIL